MGLIPDELKIQMFPCPNCGHYINDQLNACKFCSTPLTKEAKKLAIAGEKANREKLFVGTEKQLMRTGGVIAGAGLLNIVFPFFDFYLNYSWGLRIPCLSVIAVILGVATFLHGLRGYLRETRR